MGSILNKLPFDIEAPEADFPKDILLLMLQEYNEIMFLREITHTVNAFNDMADIIRLYSKKPKAAATKLVNFLSEKDPESV